MFLKNFLLTTINICNLIDLLDYDYVFAALGLFWPVLECIATVLACIGTGLGLSWDCFGLYWDCIGLY